MYLLVISSKLPVANNKESFVLSLPQVTPCYSGHCGNAHCWPIHTLKHVVITTH